MRRHYESVLRFFQLKARLVAEDLTQKTFLAAVESQQMFRGDASFKAYLYGIARRQLLKYLRDSHRLDHVILFGEADKQDSAPTPSRVVSNREEQQLLLRAFDAVPIDFQIALQLFYWEGMRNREIAEVLEIPVSTVTSRIARARQLVADKIDTLPARDKTRASLQADVEGWTRSLAGAPPTASP